MTSPLLQVNGTYNPVAAAQNASANTDGTSTEKATNAMYAAGGAVAAGAGAAYVATKNTGARAVGATGAAVTPSSNGSQDLSEKSNSDLQAEIKKLRSQVDSLQKSQSGQSSDGISIQVVAALCFGVFAFTYLFL
jgi:cobalamin biosynthesis Mg chelatase CobN